MVTETRRHVVSAKHDEESDGCSVTSSGASFGGSSLATTRNSKRITNNQAHAVDQREQKSANRLQREPPEQTYASTVRFSSLANECSRTPAGGPVKPSQMQHHQASTRSITPDSHPDASRNGEPLDDAILLRRARTVSVRSSERPKGHRQAANSAHVRDTNASFSARRPASSAGSTRSVGNLGEHSSQGRPRKIEIRTHHHTPPARVHATTVRQETLQRLSAPKHVTLPRNAPFQRTSREVPVRQMESPGVGGPQSAAVQRQIANLRRGVPLQTAEHAIRQMQQVHHERPLSPDVVEQQMRAGESPMDSQMAECRSPASGPSWLTSIFPFADPAQQWKQAHSAVSRENLFLKQNLTQAKQENDRLNASLVKLKETNDQFNAELREVQKNSFREMSKSSWTPLEDRTIREVLDEIHKDIEDWADDNCVESLEEVGGRLNEDESRTFLTFLRSVAMVEGQDLSTQMTLWVDKDLDPVLLLTAIVSHHMYLSVFKNPFLVLDTFNEQGQLPRSEMTQSMYQMLCGLNMKQAHQWRSQLMRILFPKPPATGRFDGLHPAKEEMSIFLRWQCEALVELFEQGPTRALFRSERPEDSRSRLVDCWIRAAELFTQLQTQLACVKWFEPSVLNLVGVEAFGGKLVDAHRCQSFPAGRNENKVVGLVISPLVALFGNEDGQKYEEWRPISKAVAITLDEEGPEDGGGQEKSYESEESDFGVTLEKDDVEGSVEDEYAEEGSVKGPGAVRDETPGASSELLDDSS